MRRVSKEQWFKANNPYSKWVGFQGPYPITWQGWAITIGYISSMFIEVIIIRLYIYNSNLIGLLFFI
ncbi:MAG: hypothetical protein ACLQG5_09180 [Methanobacterium sp.]|jgi:hypothetical protein